MQPIKDYYSILGIPPSSNQKEIKQAYRKLAIQYHPDKHLDDKYKLSMFEEIKEAYEVLTNQRRKNEYLQQRWYEQSIGNKLAKGIADTPENILEDVIGFERFARNLNPFRADKKTLLRKFEMLLTDKRIILLNDFKEAEINNQIKNMLLKTFSLMNYEDAKSSSEKIIKIIPDDQLFREKINLFLNKKKRKEDGSKYKDPVILMITLIICLLIYFLSQQ